MIKPTIKISYGATKPIDWKTRALLAEAELTATRQAVTTAEGHLTIVEMRLRQRAALISIVKDGRLLKFNFVRNGQLHQIETYGTMGDDVAGWKKALLDDLPGKGETTK